MTDVVTRFTRVIFVIQVHLIFKHFYMERCNFQSSKGIGKPFKRKAGVGNDNDDDDDDDDDDDNDDDDDTTKVASAFHFDSF